MANIKKNFNFRNGVQVDDDNLLVTSTGLVGIGTTVPTEALDVRGGVKIIGDANITSATVGLITITELAPTKIIGAGVSIQSGIITNPSMDATGIVTYYGDGRYLQGLPTSQWVDTNAGFGVLSIYNTGGTVGIATTNPQSTLQVGDNVDAGERGVGISSSGNINASGIITATTFSGAFSGGVTGDISGNTQGIHTGAIFLEDNVKATFGSANEVKMFHKPDTNDFRSEFASTNYVILTQALDFKNEAGNKATITAFEPGGISEVRLFNDGNEKLRTTGYGVTIFNQLETTNLNITGVSTFNNINANKDLDVDGHTNLDNVSIAGVTTFTGAFNAQGGARIGNVRIIGNSVDTVSGILQLGSTGGTVSVDDNLTITGETNAVNVVASGVITATTELNSPLLGVGTNDPANDIQVRKTGNVEIQVTSDTGVAGLTLGREAGTNNTNNAEFRYGGGAGANYSSAKSLDLLNYGTGNFNYHLSANAANDVEGDFHWHKGLNNTRLMTLTGIGGSLGIGITTPTTPLHVIGDGTITGDLEIGGDINPTGNFNGNVNGNVTGFLIGNVNATSGVSTFLRLNVDSGNYSEFGQISATGIGIGITMADKMLRINSNADARFSVSTGGNVGIRTDSVPGSIALLVGGDICSLETVGVGTNIPRSAIDFADAGQTLTGAAANRMFMVPPKVTSTQRGNLLELVSGALVYDTDSNNIQIYNGTSWSALGSGGGGGGGEANQNAFHQIAVAGQSAIIADSTTDTIILNQGTGIQYTVNAATDELTIATGGDVVSTDTSPQLGGNLDVLTNEINTSTTNGNIKLNPNGTGVVEVRGAGGNDGTLQLNCSAQSHGIKLKSPPHSAAATYTLTFPNNVVDGQFLKTNASGNLSWDSRLGPGFVNAADYGLDASKTDGTNVTAINDAIAALGINGGTILFPGGQFYLNATINITRAADENSIRFVGSGHQNYGGDPTQNKSATPPVYGDVGGTVLRRDQNNEFFNITNSRAIHFIGITFKGGSATSTGGNSGVSGGSGAITVNADPGCQGYLFENLVFHGIKNCLTLNGLSDSRIRGCRFRLPPTDEGTGQFIKIDENSGERSDQIRIENCVGDGTPDGSALNSVVDGIYISGNSNTIFVTNCSFIRLNRSYRTDGSWTGEFLYFTNAEAERASGGAGFFFDSASGGVQGNFITLDNCFSSTCESHGIHLTGTLDASVNITNCNVRGNKGHGILIDSDGGNTSIVNPVISGNSAASSGSNHGIVIGTSVSDVYIGGGRIGGNVSVKGTGTQGRGIQIDGTNHTNIRIIGANVTGNQNSEGISQNITTGNGNSIQFNAGSSVTLDT